jgi:hypothetical protein
MVNRVVPRSAHTCSVVCMQMPALHFPFCYCPANVIMMAYQDASPFFHYFTSKRLIFSQFLRRLLKKNCLIKIIKIF